MFLYAHLEIKISFHLVWFPGGALLYSYDSVLILKFLIRRPGALVELSPFRHFSLFLVRLLHLLLLPEHLFKVILKLFFKISCSLDHEIDPKVIFLKTQQQEMFMTK